MAAATTSATLLSASKQANKKELSIPLIDITPLTSPSSTAAERQYCGRAILSAFETSGFLYLSALPIPTSNLTTVFANSAAFFNRPQAQKDGLAWTTAHANRGYVAHGREKVSQGTTAEEVEKERVGNPDLKESMEIGREEEAGHPNRWPVGEGFDVEGEKFRQVMQGFFETCKDLHRVVMSAIALGMGYDEHFFDDFVRVGDNTLRLLHYPPVKREVFERNKGQVRAGAHTDYGSVTLLFQDLRGGLQVEAVDGRTGKTRWEDVTPIEGTAVVNAGDLLSRWSNGRIRSTKHRVVEPPLKEVDGTRPQQYPARYSIAYFCNPDFDKLIEALPGTWEQSGKKYEGINSGEYLVQRLTATY